ncbi:hypothetical protein FHS43_003757 [Streptosporangium becharense]|uniref:DUF3817 domain-containing protein n=1 Tax=Streptosporangium becharense TaxID=1816182 RepID=A0A7W9IHI7_9ACTN|nr:DUF3817 domain-containing protein [Streptosporangium becharense]MBB2912474.1 hypothetical protein [Streptosporangium becharense]MBB5820696.1 hypothetical protein [Streptosporangium becharense]
MPPHPLRIAARVEAVTLVVLLLNVATVHIQQITSLMGPLHGCAYIFVVAAVLRQPGADGVAKALALVPGAGGLLALRRLAGAGNAPAVPAGGAGNASAAGVRPAD